MSYFSVDIEADGPAPGIFSMLSIGAVVVEPTLSKRFYVEVKPISEIFNQEALNVCGFSREQTLEFKESEIAMKEFAEWIAINSKGRPVFISDNNGFDFAFVNYYFHRFLGNNPFGWSSRRIGDLYCGLTKDTFAKWNHLRNTKHSHNALDDAIGNAEAILKMKEMGLKIQLV